jgi:uncharacterized protein
MTIDRDVLEFNWLLDTFVRTTAGVSDAVAVSSDGLLMAQSDTLDRQGAHQVAAIISGLVSLGHSTGRCLDLDSLDQIIVAMEGGYLHVTTISGAGSLGALTDPAFDMDNIGYQMGRFVERAARMLTPALVSELKAAAAAA